MTDMSEQSSCVISEVTLNFLSGASDLMAYGKYFQYPKGLGASRAQTLATSALVRDC